MTMLVIVFTEGKVGEFSIENIQKKNSLGVYLYSIFDFV